MLILFLKKTESDFLSSLWLRVVLYLWVGAWEVSSCTREVCYRCQYGQDFICTAFLSCLEDTISEWHPGPLDLPAFCPHFQTFPGPLVQALHWRCINCSWESQGHLFSAWLPYVELSPSLHLQLKNKRFINVGFRTFIWGYNNIFLEHRKYLCLVGKTPL